MFNTLFSATDKEHICARLKLRNGRRPKHGLLLEPSLTSSVFNAGGPSIFTLFLREIITFSAEFKNFNYGYFLES